MKLSQTFFCCYAVLQEDPADRHQEFLQQQNKMEEEWATNRRAGVAKKLMLPLKEIDSASDVSVIKEQLEAKNRECDRLRNRIHDQERLCKVSTKKFTLLNNRMKSCLVYEWETKYVLWPFCIEAVNVLTCKKRSELTCLVFVFWQLMDKFEDSLLSFEENMIQRLSRIEQRLESLETAVSWIILRKTTRTHTHLPHKQQNH